MRILLLLALACTASVLVSGKHHNHHDDHDQAPDGSKRLCPDNYHYIGEDTTEEQLNKTTGIIRDVFYEEVDRSPEYSCYKVYEQPMDFISAMQRCWEDDAQLVSVEDNVELWRMQKGLDDEDQGFFTSALYFHDVGQWKWVASNQSFRSDLEIDGEQHGVGLLGKKDRDCILVSLSNNQSRAGLTAMACSNKASFICEARVQTVTYYTWFVANWIDLLLGFMLVILFVALCVSVCSFQSQPRRPTSTVNDQRRRRTLAPGQRRPRTTDPNQLDLPPSYDSTVTPMQATTVHKPPIESPTVRTITTTAGATNSPSRFDHYKNRGKEVLAKVYLYKET